MVSDQYESVNITGIPTGYTYHVDIFDEIEEPGFYSDLFTVMREATSQDVIILHLNCPGGDLETTVQILNAIYQTEAKVVTSAEGLVASGAAMIFFSGHSFQIGRHCEFLIHTASAGAAGKINDNLSSVSFAVKRLKEMYAEVLGGFLTEDELDLIARGDEFYLTSEEAADRIQAALEDAQEQVDVS